MQRRIERLRARHARAIKTVGLLLFLGAVALLGLWLNQALNVVTVKSDNGACQVLLTASHEPAELLTQADFTAAEHDEVLLSATAEGTLLEIRAAFPASATADGAVYTGHFVQGTVADLLAEAGITLGPDDYVLPAPDTALATGTTARVHRVEYVEEVRREELDESTLAAYRETLPPGFAFIESTNGPTYDVLYRDKLVNGAVAESTIIELLPVIEAPSPRPADSFTIEEGVPCSRIEGYDDIEFGTDGLPVGYTRVMSGAVATAYSSSGGRGSSGLGLYCGTIAVNPNVIPYGTRVWITDRSQSFIYGFAIATDTGTAMMEGHVDIDLYFETNAECRQFGKRQLDVYVFGPPPAEAEEPLPHE